VEPPEFGSWLGAKFVDEHLPGMLVGGQRLGPPAAPIEGEYELRVKTFS
jgi:hypothetical protein